MKKIFPHKICLGGVNIVSIGKEGAYVSVIFINLKEISPV